MTVGSSLVHQWNLTRGRGSDRKPCWQTMWVVCWSRRAESNWLVEWTSYRHGQLVVGGVNYAADAAVGASEDDEDDGEMQLDELCIIFFFSAETVKPFNSIIVSGVKSQRCSHHHHHHHHHHNGLAMAPLNRSSAAPYKVCLVKIIN